MDVSERPFGQPAGHEPSLASRLGPPGDHQAQLLALADRCEAATGPDYGLDALITIALEPGRLTIVGNEPGRFPQKPIYGPITELIPMAEANGKDAAQFLSAPAYTASLDAAMTLAPEPHKWAITASSHDGGWQAWVWQIEGVPNWHEAATPALALTAAALRARDA